MADRPKMFDDLAGLAGGAFSALAGLREEAEALVRARVDETLRKLDLVRREELDAVAELAANARANCYCVLPPRTEDFVAGETVRVLLR